jgi:hypothetical protein
MNQNGSLATIIVLIINMRSYSRGPMIAIRNVKEYIDGYGIPITSVG